MGVIKSEQAPTKLAAFSLADIEAQAHAIIVRAKSQAGRILAEAQRIGEELKKQSQEAGFAQGKDEGFAAGHRDGLDAGQQQALGEHRESLQKLIDALSAASVDLNESRRALETEASTDVLLLAVAIARKVTKQLALDGATVVSANVREAMKLAVHASDVRIAVHPSQKQSLEAVLPELQKSWPAMEHVALIEDESLAPGGCRIFTAGGQIDADLENQISRIAAELIPSQQPE
jgi:flagellar assembly protein FliH